VKEVIMDMYMEGNPRFSSRPHKRRLIWVGSTTLAAAAAAKGFVL